MRTESVNENMNKQKNEQIFASVNDKEIINGRLHVLIHSNNIFSSFDSLYIDGEPTLWKLY